MSRTAPPPPVLDPSALMFLADMSDAAPSPDAKLETLAAWRREIPDANALIDQFLLAELHRNHAGLRLAREHQAELRALLAQLTASPWHPAIFLGTATTADGPAAQVAYGGSRRLVGLNEGVALEALHIGDEVFLTKEANAIVAAPGTRTLRGGEVASFDRFTADGRIVVTAREEEFVVDAAARLAELPLKPGDLLRWDRAAAMAFELIERSKGTDYFLEDTPRETFAEIGGLDLQIEELKRALFMRFRHGALVAKYGLQPPRSVLLYGPPGTGKTMLARAAANGLQAISPSGQARFINIKPGSLHSMWYAQSEKNYREVFRVAREAGARDPDIPIVIFFDEVDAIGASRSAGAVRIDDRVLTAFMAELDGLESRGNVMVVASTNRFDALDSALTRPGRLGDCVIHVPSPNRKAARAILGKHLRVDLPYAENGHGADLNATREEMLDATIARLFAPNGESDVATMMFRDGKRRDVKARDLVSGAVLAKIARAAIERACVREASAGDPGVRLEDLAWAADGAMTTAAHVLTPANCRAYLTDLPQDVDVVSVQPVTRAVPRVAAYLM